MASLNYTQISPILNTMYEEYTGRKTGQNLSFGQMQNTFKMGLDREDDNLYQIIPTVLANQFFQFAHIPERFLVWCGIVRGTEIIFVNLRLSLMIPTLTTMNGT